MPETLTVPELNLASPLVQDMIRIGILVMTSYRTDINHDIAALQKHGKPGWRALWLLKEYSTHCYIVDHEPEEIQNPDFLRSLRGWHEISKNLIDREGYDTCYLITLTDPTKPDGELKLMSTRKTEEFLNQLLLELPEPPPPDRSKSLLISNMDYYNTVVEQAATLGLLDKLSIQLERLRNFSSRQYYQCVLYPDFAPLSFCWSAQVKSSPEGDWKQFMNGGLIFHSNSSDWSIHT